MLVNRLVGLRKMPPQHVSAILSVLSRILFRSCHVLLIEKSHPQNVRDVDELRFSSSKNDISSYGIPVFWCNFLKCVILDPTTGLTHVCISSSRGIIARINLHRIKEIIG